MFTKSLKSPYTRKTYGRELRLFKEYAAVSELQELVTMSDQKMIQDILISYLLKLEERGLAYQTRNVAFSAIKHFYEINDITLNWKKIARFLGENKKTVEDRPYTYDEIKQLLTKCDERKRVIVYLMASTGMRLGAVAGLRIKHLKRIGELYQFTLYEGTTSKHITFCTPECAQAIDSYLDYRRRCGERIGPESPLIRNQFDKNSIEQAVAWKPISTAMVHTLLYQLVYDAGLRSKPLEGHGYQRKEVMAVHGFRKFFSTNLNRAIKNPLMVELLIGHDTGLTGVYTKPSEEDKYNAYVGGIDALTIDEAHRLQSKLAEKEAVISENNNIIKSLMDDIQGRLLKGGL